MTSSKGLGKGLGKWSAAHCCRRIPPDVTRHMKPALRRLARRGGVKRIARPIYDDVRGALRLHLEDILREAVLYTEHGYRTTVTSSDVLHAFKRNGRVLYGFSS
ncbi:hypothetical protein C8R44DRAFT_663771 [Mycena epipterygia]|nr:hypothetical protein C8R44DRAFT_663771 [Mycena epipterygia]